MSNSLFLSTLNNPQANHSRPPVWFMRQAGRALASYRALKEQYSFIELLRDPKLAADVTLLPEVALGIDALILFSDILVIPEALGVKVDYESGGPKMSHPLKLTKPTSGVLPKKSNLSVLDSVYQTIIEIKNRNTSLPLIGFCGGPLTVFLYLYQGSGHGGNFDDALDFFYNEPKGTDKVLERITEMSIEYATGQIKHGVDAFQIFETWANIIPANIYVERVLPYVIKIARSIKLSTPLIYYPRFFSNGYELLAPHLENFSGIGIDYLVDIETLSKKFPVDLALQGNIDPTYVKYATPTQLQSFLNSYFNFAKKRSGWIVNLGHGVLPGTPEENLKLIVDTVKAMK